MASPRHKGATLTVAGLLLVAAGLLMSKADQPVFGLSSDFLAGFMLGAGVLLEIAGVARLLSDRRSD